MHVDDHLNLMDKIRSNTILNDNRILNPRSLKLQGLGLKGLEFGGLRLGGLDPIGLEFESLVSNPSILDPRPALRGSGPS